MHAVHIQNWQSGSWGHVPVQRLHEWRVSARALLRQVHPQRRRFDSQHLFMGVAAAWTGLDMSTSLIPEVVPEIDANPEHKTLNLYTRTREHYCCFVARHFGTIRARHARQAWHDRHDALDTSYVSCRDVTQQVDLGLINVGYFHRQTSRRHPKLATDSIVD